MSHETAYQLLEVASQDSTIREKLEAATDPNDFIKIAETLGYQFTLEDLKAVVEENSAGVELRRKTGIWPWLRTVHIW